MSYAAIHLHLSPYPAPTSAGAIDYACALARLFDAKLNVSSSHLTVRSPANWLTGVMMTKMAKELEGVTSARSAQLESHLERVASDIQLRLTRVEERWPVGMIDSSWRGRISDICVLSLSRNAADPRLDIEDWLFGVGRPCILYPEDSTQTFSTENVLICWDFSRSAARAVSDALPLLHNARRVRIAIFRGEKDIPIEDAKTPLLEFLAAHGVVAEAEEIEIGDRTIGKAILGHANATSTNLILMGAFGHSRLKEFLLGGATKEILDKSTIPVLMSH